MLRFCLKILPQKELLISHPHQVTKDTEAHTEDESSRKPWSKPTKPLNSPAKNLRFFGDTDQDSDTYTKQQVSKSRSHPSGS